MRVAAGPGCLWGENGALNWTVLGGDLSHIPSGGTVTCWEGEKVGKIWHVVCISLGTWLQVSLQWVTSSGTRLTLRPRSLSGCVRRGSEHCSTVVRGDQLPGSTVVRGDQLRGSHAYSVDGHNMTGAARAYYAGIILPAFQSSCGRCSPSWPLITKLCMCICKDRISAIFESKIWLTNVTTF